MHLTSYLTETALYNVDKRHDERHHGNALRIGTPSESVTGTNFERWSDHTTDQLLKQYSTLRNPAIQLQAIQGLGKVMVEQVAAIPLTYNPYWAEYTTTNLQGWPDASNPYDVAAP